MKLEFFYDIFDTLTLQTNYFQVCYKRQNIICMFKVNYKDVLMNILCIYVFFLRKKENISKSSFSLKPFDRFFL